ncbi:hypothetical protein HAX54_035833 [Datura stramonium]|uniref:Uncharacterized protein n=1 Tax=Datura stramonium TaxID=4076 RepID=A0ABS8RM83_DATST|nr:hypothetical protein [Datura stramonium]
MVYLYGLRINIPGIALTLSRYIYIKTKSADRCQAQAGTSFLSPPLAAEIRAGGSWTIASEYIYYVGRWKLLQVVKHKEFAKTEGEKSYFQLENHIFFEEFCRVRDLCRRKLNVLGGNGMGEFHIEDHPSLDLDDCGDDRRDHHQLFDARNKNNEQ